LNASIGGHPHVFHQQQKIGFDAFRPRFQPDAAGVRVELRLGERLQLFLKIRVGDLFHDRTQAQHLQPHRRCAISHQGCP
jgi:hypothetical protein